ncbi:MAG: response regulator transcription factor [Planctomycetaceae bacterium]
MVDDEVVVRDAVSALLTASGLECHAFSSSQDFLNAVSPTLRGCVLVDFRMPSMDGLELYKELKQRSFTLPVIFLTAHADVPLAVQTMKEGAADLIEKPFRNEDLLERVRVALQKDSKHAKLYSKLERLSPREKEVANLMAEGLSTKAIAEKLGSSAHTVRNQRTSIFRKMKVQSVVELVRIMNNPDTVGDTND